MTDFHSENVTRIRSFMALESKTASGWKVRKNYKYQMYNKYLSENAFESEINLQRNI